MKFFRKSTFVLFLTLLLAGGASAAPETVIVGGNVIGMRMLADGVSIVEFTEAAPERVGLKRGDVLQKINGEPIHTAKEIEALVEACGTQPLELTVLRSGKQKQFTLSPTQTSEGKKLGILVREELRGIGTVTYYDPESGTFGALGHGVSDGTTLLPITGGDVLSSKVASVVKGEQGDPGCLQGLVSAKEKNGEILKNTPQGIFGRMHTPAGESLPIAEKSEIRTGKAQIISNVRGDEVRYYDVQILAIYPREKHDRNLLVEVTDDALLAQTGGIVQGMSGSPIVQDGKLIGAVTHVLIDDPTRGYGIFIENMLDAA